jgi:peptidyl-dipeptidase Dcp
MTTTTRGLLASVLTLALIACEQAPREDEPVRPEPQETRPAVPADNPLLTRYLTPFQTPPFHRLEPSHFLPALEQAIQNHREVIAQIADDSEAASLANTIEALEYADRDLARVTRTLTGLIAVSDDPSLHEIAPEFSALQADYEHAVLFNRDLFARIESVHDRLEALAPDPEQRRLTELSYQRFVHAGARAGEPEQERLRAINTRLAELNKRLDPILRKERSDEELLIEDETLLKGLPESLVTLAARSARERGHPGGWVFTLHEHSLQPFLAHFPGREERRAMYEAWIRPFSNDSDWANLVHEMAELRAERAELLGFESHLDHALAGSTIGSRERLRELLDGVTAAARTQVSEEISQLEALARADGLDDPLAPWDWWYYRERLRESEIEQTDAELRDWFTLEQARDGAFALANRLWGLSFHVRTDLPLWDTDVETYEVRDAMGGHLGVIYLDHQHREGKRTGHWTFVHRPAHRDGDERIAPVVANVANFPRAAAGLPSLLSPGDVEILFRQFGRALHELLSDTAYPTTAASSLPADFAGLMGHLMQGWALQPEVLRMYAYHHETGGLITDQAIDALAQDRQLLSGIQTMQQIAAIELELAIHDVDAGEVPELGEAIESVRERLALPALVSAHFHENGLADLFSAQQPGACLALWAEMLAADAFAAFGEATVLDRNLAERLREEILVAGNSRDPMRSWQAFRDREPRLEYLLEARGLGD